MKSLPRFQSAKDEAITRRKQGTLSLKLIRQQEQKSYTGTKMRSDFQVQSNYTSRIWRQIFLTLSFVGEDGGEDGEEDSVALELMIVWFSLNTFFLSWVSNNLLQESFLLFTLLDLRNGWEEESIEVAVDFPSSCITEGVGRTRTEEVLEVKLDSFAETVDNSFEGIDS